MSHQLSAISGLVIDVCANDYAEQQAKEGFPLCCSHGYVLGEAKDLIISEQILRSAQGDMNMDRVCSCLR